MSRFSIDETYPDPQPENAGTGLIASVTINPERPFIAAASALAAHMAGSDLILARAAARPESATDMIRDLLESARVPLAVALGCSGVLNAIALKEAGADEIMCIMQMGGVPHEVAMETIRQYGEYVIPHFS